MPSPLGMLLHDGLPCAGTQALCCRHNTDTSSDYASRSQQLNELQEQVVSLQAALSSSETHKHSLELELTQLRVDLEGLRYQAAHSVSPAEMEQRLREVNPRNRPFSSQLLCQRVAFEQAGRDAGDGAAVPEAVAAGEGGR